MIEVFHQTKIRILRSDNGGEYTSSAFDNLLKSRGIQRQLTIPATPQQNGVAERYNQTLLNTARCMLVESGLPETFWAEAISTAAYVRNRCPTIANEGMTPYEKLMKKPFDASNLRVFGCRAWVKNRHRRGKFAPKANPGIFVGYATASKAYRFYNPLTLDIVISRDIIFDENSFPMKLRPPGVLLTESVDWNILTVGKEACSPPETMLKNTTLPTDVILDFSSADVDEIIENEGRIAQEVDRQETDEVGTDEREASAEVRELEIETVEVGTDEREPQRNQISDQIVKDDAVRPQGTHMLPNANLMHQGHSDVTVNPTSRSGREIKKPVWMNAYETNPNEDISSSEEEENDGYLRQCQQAQKDNKERDPMSAREALSGINKEEWEKSMSEEIENLARNQAWDIVKLPKGKSTVKSKWIFKTKYDEDGQLVRRKSRLVALGYSQKPGLDYDQTYAPVVQKKTMRLLFAISAEKNWEIHHVDVQAAYLMAELDDEVYMEIPEKLENVALNNCAGFDITKRIPELRRQGFVCKLKKSLYGLHQSGRKWNLKIDAFLKSKDFQRSRADPCVYFHKTEELLVSLYVDDLLLYGRIESINKFKSTLSMEFDTRDLGEARNVLSIAVKQTNDEITLNQATYAKSLLQEMGMHESKPVKTPLNLNEKLQTCENGDALDGNRASAYRTAVGSLLYLATCSRPDLAHTASLLSQFNQNPSSKHWMALKHALRYLKGTVNRGLSYKRTGQKLKVFSDADWGCDTTDRKSFTGYAVILAGSVVSWGSRKQRYTALSTVEAEFVALSETTKECLWVRHFLEEIGLEKFVTHKIEIFVDNQGAIKLAENQSISERSKHIQLKMFHVRDHIEEGTIRLSYVPTELNLADMLTKTISGCKMVTHMNCMGIVDPGEVLARS